MNTSIKTSNLVLTALLLLLTLNCSVVKDQKRGSVSPNTFHYKTDFTSIKSIIVLPVKVDGVSKNFLFDTGAQLSIIQRKELVGKTGKVIGASNRKALFGSEVVSSIKIGNIDFKNTYALNRDLADLKEKVPNFGGIVGQPIIKKANWLINYPKREIEISNKHLVDDTYRSIKIKREGGSPYTYITINGQKYKAVIDLGSSSKGLNIPKDHPLAEKILSTYNFTDNEREIYTIGGNQMVKEKIGTVPSILLGDIEFKNVLTDIRHSSQLRLGIGFFKDYSIYIDNINGDYKIKKHR
ncbi:pepsin/retropepsin-like aspartic protease family protein [Winogradskyella immobilis]|uniref:Retropepsin-like domain-containing protein n=1 Tax=Winogradskyella immobilis TaxID=2816852 RepID=A0ABS8ELG8_9FLAO|nr:hypothetical protein [Winogradskyella immobilis]MCC1484051.1 retropepsin-like domain-containing protein [Winogradskyella immobilis]MCG0016143.1 hypothetical protein [Winogradskyella immobilis]